MAILNDHGFEKVRLWPRGVDISLFSPLQRSESLRAQWMGVSELKSENKTVILYVGRVSYEKNINLVIEAYKEMNHEKCHLVLVGHGPAFHEIQSYCSAKRIPVTFTGYLQGKDLSQAYASADIFAFPSVTETFGQVVLEAMSSGLPVVGLDAEGVRDLVDDKRTGLLLDTFELPAKDQQKKYRDLLERLVDQPHLLGKLRREAVKKAKTYTWYEAMECMVNVYQDAVGCSEDELPVSLKLYLKHNSDGSLVQEQELKRVNPTATSSSDTAENAFNEDSGDSGVEEDYALCDEESNLLLPHAEPTTMHTNKEEKKSWNNTRTYLTNN
ncbi:hypothetical protein G6F42_024770 [Rhizopus arrhizus]|nr:hypothetical protein G6F42_024770 [Rhizopus arrhizus]